MCCSLLFLSLTCNSPTRSLPGPGVGAGSLASDRQSLSVPKPPIATQFHESLYVHGNIGPEFPLDFVLAVNDLSDSANLVLS